MQVDGTFWLIDPETGSLVCCQASGPYGRVVRHWRLQPGQGIAGWVAQHCESLVIGEATLDPRHFGGIDAQTGHVYHSILCVPLQSKQNVIGALQVLDTKPNRFCASDVSFVESLAATVANAIENARLYDQVQRELTQRRNTLDELRQTMEELKASEMQFRKLIVKNVDGIIVIDETGVIRFVNPAAEALFGHTGEELVGNPFGLITLDQDKTEINIRRPGGSVATAELRAVEIDWHGQRANLVSLRDVTERKRTEQVLRSLSLLDELTGLYNRRGFLALSQQELKLAQREQRHVLLFFVDIDRMKWINDTLGHSEGDWALTAIADVLRETWRASDIIARLGGDEFAVLAMQSAGIGTMAMKDRLQKNLNLHNAKENRGYDLSLSVGAVDYDPANPCSIDELLARADALMYQEKQGKRNGR
jgi:diguanylate cyclase (GGDEF)-like protein